MNCRLFCNVIVGGKNYPRDSIIDDGMLPERCKNHASYDLEHKDGLFLLLRDFSFMGLPVSGSDNVPTSYPRSLAMGELLDLAIVPEGKRQELVEGLDYRANWTHEEMEQLKLARADVYKDAEAYAQMASSGWRHSR